MGKPVSSTIIKDEKTFKISLKDFDEKGNIATTGYVGLRGGVKYVQPPKGWIRKGLKVSGKYDNGNDDWLSTNDKAWPVAYHGFRHCPDFAIPKVIKGGLRPGFINLKTKNVPAIYCSPSFEYVLKYYSLPIE